MMRTHNRIALSTAVVVIATLIGAATPASAQTCPELIGRWPYGPANAVALDATGTIAYLATGSVLQILDFTNPDVPNRRGSLTLPAPIRAIAVFDHGSNRYAYVADGLSGLRVVDVTDPDIPQEILGLPDWPFSGEADDVEVRSDGNYAYMVLGRSGPAIVNISDPLSPTLEGWCDSYGYCRQYFSGPAALLAVDFPYAYLVSRGTGTSRISVVDVSDPGLPIETDFLDIPAYILDIALDDARTHLWVADSTGMHLVDLGVPGQLSEISLAGPSPFGGNPFVSGVDLAGTNAYFTNRLGLWVFDVSVPSAPQLTRIVYDTGDSNGVVSSASANRIYVLSSTLGLVLVDSSNPFVGPYVRSSFAAPGPAEGVASDGTTLYIADRTGLRLIDRATLTETHFVPTPGGAIAVALSADGAYAYVADSGAGLAIIKLSAPAGPFLERSYTSGHSALDVAVNGNFAYVADGWAGLRIIDLTDTIPPVSVDTPGDARAVALTPDGNYAYIADNYSGVQVIDLNASPEPKIVFSVPTDHFAADIAFDSDRGRAYVTEWRSIRILDVTTPSAPTTLDPLLDFGAIGGGLGRIEVGGGYAYVTNVIEGLFVLDLSVDPPEIKAPYQNGDSAIGVAIDATDVYVADGNNGLMIFSRCDIGAPAPHNTPAGTNVSVAPQTTAGETPFTLTFDEVTVAGETTVTATDCAAPPVGYEIADGTTQTCFDISTTAGFAGSINVCFSWTEGDFADETILALFHDDGSGWADITTRPGYPDIVANTICGVTTSLSPFGIFQLANQPPIADAGPDFAVECSSPASTPAMLDGSMSSDPDGDPLSFEWEGPFGTATGAMPTVDLGLGTSAITLTVNDGQGASSADAVSVTVSVGVEGLQPPMSQLVRQGEATILPDHAFNAGRTVPLKLRLACGATALDETTITPPRVVGLKRTGGASDEPVIEPGDAGGSNGDGPLFRSDGDAWIYNLETKGLLPGTYDIIIEMPDGLRYVAGLTLR